MHFFVMKKLMTANNSDSGKKANHKNKTKIIRIVVWFLNAVEQVSLRIIVIAHYDTSPNRNKSFHYAKELERNIKSFVISECLLGFGT